MDFSDERYVRVYSRDTATWKRLGWEGQCTLMQVLRRLDRAGALDLGGLSPAEGVSVVTDGPVEFVAAGVAKLIGLGIAVHDGDRLVFPRFLDAQECSKSDKQRQRESRERRRDRREQAGDDAGLLYAVVTGDGSLKVGFTTDLELRLGQIRTHRPDGVTLLGIMNPGTQADEKRTHAALAPWSIGREWFLDSTELRASLEAIGFKLAVSQNVTAVTSGHSESQPVTPCCAVPSRSVPSEEMILPRPHARDVGDGEGEGIEGGGKCEVREVRRETRDDPERTAAAAGSRRLQRLGLLGFHHVGEHAAFLAELSRKTPEEWRIAEPVIRQMVNAKNFPVTPRHLVDKWHRYGAGLPPLTAVDVERDRAARKPVVAIRADPPPQTYHRMIDLNTVAE